MTLPLGVALNYILLDASMSLVAFIVGFGAAYVYVRSHMPKAPKSLDPDSDPEAQAKLQEAERNNMAVMQLKDLASNVASEVGTHNQIVSGISDRLGALDKNSPDTRAAVTTALGEILAANERLQARLEEAENKIQSQAEQLKSQQSEARTDSLTQLANRRAFDDAIAEGVEAYRSTGRPMCLMMFDVDHFKKFNDTHGHQAGDEVLRIVGQTLKTTAKSTDEACRYGGEEFALVMPNTTIGQAKVAVERVRKAIESAKVQFENQVLSVTASVGVAEIDREDDCKSLIRRSDEAIYCAKSVGRNCSYWHDGEGCLPIDEPTPEEETDDANSKIASTQSWKLVDLPDRVAFGRELQRRVAETHREGNTLSVMYLKIVGFAALERDYGSAVLDMVQECVAQFIGSKLREMDLLGRTESGAFAIMLPGSSEREATIVGNRVQSALSKCPIPLGASQITLHLARSVTSVRPNDSADSLIHRAMTGADAPAQAPATAGA